MYEVRALGRDFVVYVPGTRDSAFASVSSGFEAEEGDDVADVGVEDLFVGCVGWCTDFGRVAGAEVGNVVEHDVGWGVVEGVVLAAADGGYVGG